MDTGRGWAHACLVALHSRNVKDCRFDSAQGNVIMFYSILSIRFDLISHQANATIFDSFLSYVLNSISFVDGNTAI